MELSPVSGAGASLVAMAARHLARRQTLALQASEPVNGLPAAVPQVWQAAPRQETPVTPLQAPFPKGPTPQADVPASRNAPPEQRLLDEAELRRLLTRIIQTDALRYGLDLKER